MWPGRIRLLAVTRKAPSLNKNSLRDSELFSVRVTKAICCRLYDTKQRSCNISLRADILENENDRGNSCGFVYITKRKLHAYGGLSMEYKFYFLGLKATIILLLEIIYIFNF